MLKNRKVQVLVVIVLIVTAFVATIAAVNPSTPSKADLSWPLRPDFSADSLAAIPVTGNSVFPDYYQRHPELRAGTTKLIDLTDYFFRHPELRGAAVETIDECFDVSLSEVAECREASQAPSQ